MTKRVSGLVKPVAQLTMLGIVSLLIASCSSSKRLECQVKGKVLYKGEPAEGAQVIFHPKAGGGMDETKVPSGTVEADGTFTLFMDKDTEGAPAGEYYVFIRWRDLDAPPPPNGKRKMKSIPDDWLKGRYTDHKNPKFFASLKPGMNELAPFVIEDAVGTSTAPKTH